jgi:hypothetical protein
MAALKERRPAATLQMAANDHPASKQCVGRRQQQQRDRQGTIGAM